MSSERFAVHVGDNLPILKTLPDNSVDAIVTDPPAGIGFMGKEWDKDKGGRDKWIDWMAEVAAECLRVIKPGGHALVWALPRTSHWTATAWENAGWEPRDRICHIFSTGFPKSANISKQIDRMAGAEREVVSTNPNYRPNSGAIADPKWWQDRSSGLITAPATDAAKQWDGYGTALKPAVEDYWLFRKPIEKGLNIAENVLKWGTGGLNIDGCRVQSGIQIPIGRVEGSGEAVQGTRPKDQCDRTANRIPKRRSNRSMDTGKHGCGTWESIPSRYSRRGGDGVELDAGVERRDPANPERLRGECVVSLNAEGIEFLSRSLAQRPGFRKLSHLDQLDFAVRCQSLSSAEGDRGGAEEFAGDDIPPGVFG